MKKAPFLCTILLLFTLLTGCASSGGSEESGTGKLDDIPFEDSQWYAAAYLGYQEMSDLDVYAERYLDSSRLPIHYLSSGDYYLIIPRYAGMSLSLFQTDIETGDAVLRFEDPDCEPFVLQCNASDIFADAVIRLTYEGESVEFSPFISLKDGALDVGPRGLDLTNAEAAGTGGQG